MFRIGCRLAGRSSRPLVPRRPRARKDYERLYRPSGPFHLGMELDLARTGSAGRVGSGSAQKSGSPGRPDRSEQVRRVVPGQLFLKFRGRRAGSGQGRPKNPDRIGSDRPTRPDPPSLLSSNGSTRSNEPWTEERQRTADSLRHPQHGSLGTRKSPASPSGSRKIVKG